MSIVLQNAVTGRNLGEIFGVQANYSLSVIKQVYTCNEPMSPFSLGAPTSLDVDSAIPGFGVVGFAQTGNGSILLQPLQQFHGCHNGQLFLVVNDSAVSGSSHGTLGGSVVMVSVNPSEVLVLSTVEGQKQNTCGGKKLPVGMATLVF